MTRNNRRKRPVRARMGSTGEVYSVAARRTGTSPDGLYRREEWRNSGWHRLLPYQGLDLEHAICSATEYDRDGSLADILSWIGESILDDQPLTPATPLDWDSKDTDEESRALRIEARDAFAAGLHAAGQSMPTTVGQLADTLAVLGVYEHIHVGGNHRWRASDDLPEPSLLLSMPDTWLERDDHARWITRTASAAYTLYVDLTEQGRPQTLTTSISQIADRSGRTAGLVREGIEGLCRRGGITLRRNSTTIIHRDLQRLADHARFEIILRWATLDDEWSPHDDDLLETRFAKGSPWSTVRALQNDASISADTVKVIAAVTFAVRRPGTRGGRMSLLELAADQGLSLTSCVNSMVELEKAQLIRWDHDSQALEFLVGDHSD